MDDRKKRHIEWSKRQEKKPSMKRRCDEHDYTQRGIYMITMATEGRLPLFGTLEGDPMVTSGDNKPHIILSPLGEKVKACWLDIPAHYPNVSVIKLCVMPPVSSSVQPSPSVHYTEALPQLTKQPLVSQSTKHPVTGVLWESGYNDRILLQEGQLQRMLDYLDDNPRRLLLKRASPQYFKPLGKLTVAGISLHVSALARDRLLQPFWKRNFLLSSCS